MCNSLMMQVNVRPFAQSSVTSACICIIDTFFELYTIVSEEANSKKQDILAALDFCTVKLSMCLTLL